MGEGKRRCAGAPEESADQSPPIGMASFSRPLLLATSPGNLSLAPRRFSLLSQFVPRSRESAFERRQLQRKERRIEVSVVWPKKKTRNKIVETMCNSLGACHLSVRSQRNSRCLSLLRHPSFHLSPPPPLPRTPTNLCFNTGMQQRRQFLQCNVYKKATGMRAKPRTRKHKDKEKKNQPPPTTPPPPCLPPDHPLPLPLLLRLLLLLLLHPLAASGSGPPLLQRREDLLRRPPPRL